MSFIIPQMNFSPLRSVRDKWISLRGSSALYCMRWQISTDVWLLIDGVHKNTGAFPRLGTCVLTRWLAITLHLSLCCVVVALYFIKMMYGTLLVLSVIRISLSVSRRCSLPFRWTEPPWGRSGWNYTRRCWFAVVKDASGVWKYQTRLCLTAEKHKHTSRPLMHNAYKGHKCKYKSWFCLWE